LLQDADLRQRQQREQSAASTFHQFAQQETLPQGRFSAPGGISTPQVVGSVPAPSSQYPACSPALQVQLPNEPPLGSDNPALGVPPFPQEPAGAPAFSAPSSVVQADSKSDDVETTAGASFPAREERR
jgi:hypothetical protein